MATHSSILAWRIPWTEEPGGLQSMRSQSQTQWSDQHFTSVVLDNKMYFVVLCIHHYPQLFPSVKLKLYQCFVLIFIFKTFIKYGNFIHYFFKYSTCFTVSSSGTPTVCMLVCMMVSYRPLMLCSLFFSLFLCCFSDLIIFTILLTSLLILFSVHKSDFESLSGFFYISHFTFSSKLLFAPLCFLPLIDISLCSYFIFLTFSMLSFSSSNVFKIVI